ncbi:hypothetical protein ACLOJK_037631 [Asimina triloba]
MEEVSLPRMVAVDAVGLRPHRIWIVLIVASKMVGLDCLTGHSPSVGFWQRRRWLSMVAFEGETTGLGIVDGDDSDGRLERSMAAWGDVDGGIDSFNGDSRWVSPVATMAAALMEMVEQHMGHRHFAAVS